MEARSCTDPLSIKNWIDDINTFKQSYKWCSGCEVHKGFYNTYLSVPTSTASSIIVIIFFVLFVSHAV